MTFNSKPHFYNHADNVVVQPSKNLKLIGYITFPFYPTDCLITLYCALVRSEVEIHLCDQNSVTLTDSSKTEFKENLRSYATISLLLTLTLIRSIIF